VRLFVRSWRRPGITCVSLLVGRLWSPQTLQSLCVVDQRQHVSSIRRKWPVSAALPELVTWVIVEILEMSPACTVQQRVHSENCRSQNGSVRPTAIPEAPHLCCFTAATTAELPCC